MRLNPLVISFISLADAIPLTMAAIDLLAHSSFHVFQSHTRNYGLRFKIKVQPQVAITNHAVTVSCKSNLESTPQASESDWDDFVTRVLKENPSQVEPKFLIGDKFYTLKEKEYLSGKKDAGLAESLVNSLNLKGEENKTNGDIRRKSVLEADPIYLNDILREYRGKLYVPDQFFGMNLSEEDEFDRNLAALPKMSIGDFQKAIKSDKIKLLTSKEYRDLLTANDRRDIIVDLKEIPGARSLHRTQWALRLSDDSAQSILEEYKGPRYEIEKRTTSWVGKFVEHPHPIASSISGRMIVELGMLTAVMAFAAFVVGGFLASAIFAVTSFVFATAFYIIWPVTKPFVKFFHGIIFGMLERVWDNLADLFLDGGVFSKIYEFYTFGGVAASLEVLKPIALVLFTMVLLVRFTLSRRPKNFRKWDLWQGIDFSRSKAEARVDGSTGVKFSDVAGIDEAVEELQELVRYLKNPELFDKMGIKPPHGVLLEGPPGCGKTLVAKAIAGEAGVPFYQMAGSEFVEVLVGVGSARIRDLFKRAKVNKPSVIFIDEIDALAAKRQSIFKEATDYLYNAATQERETTLNQLLIELDGFDTGKGVIFLAATNRRDLLDPALLRPGRFDRKIRIHCPNTKGRLDILKIHASKVKMSDSVDLSTYAKNLPGWTGAMLAQLVQEAALVAVRKRHDAILQSDMDEAVDRITVGPKRIGFELGHEARCRRAATEVGVALTSHLLRRYENAEVEPCDRISLVPRGQTLSQAVFNRLDDELYVFERRSQLLHRLQVLLGGRAAEEVIYGRDTSRVSVGYLADASWLARKILTIWNLENPMAIHGEPPTWSKKVKFVGPRLDFEGFLYDYYGLIEVPLNFKLDDQVVERTEELIRKMYGKTVDLLRRNHAALLKVIKVLLNQAEMSGAEIEFILDKYPPHTPWKLLLEEENPESIPFYSRGEPDHSDCSAAAAQSQEPR